MRKRDTENVHFLADSLFANWDIYDLQGLLLNEEYEFTAAIEGVYLEKGEKWQDLPLFFSNKEINAKLLVAEKLDVPFYVICHCFDLQNQHRFQIIEYKRGSDFLHYNKNWDFNSTEFINWWSSLKGTIQTKEFREQGKERTDRSYIDIVLAQNNLMWGGNVDGIMICPQTNTPKAIIEKRIRKADAKIENYDPARYFYDKNDPLKNDYFTWKPLVKLAIALDCPLYLLTFRNNDNENYGMSSIKNIINGLNYYGKTPNENLHNRIDDYISFYNSNPSPPITTGNCRKCYAMVTEEDADECIKDKGLYEGKVYCSKCRSKSNEFLVQSVQCQYEGCSKELSDKEKTFCESKKLKFNNTYYCYSHQQSVEPRNICADCGKFISEKVINFCLENASRFNGQIYCFDHQKNY